MLDQFYSLSFEELQNLLVKYGEKVFHAKQIFKWLYQKQIIAFTEMTDLSENLRTQLREHFALHTLSLQQEVLSSDRQTVKFLFKLQDGYYVESVLILGQTADYEKKAIENVNDISHAKRRTICLSTQVGCPMGCSFCASTKNGFIRNLTSGEILEQALYVNRFLVKQRQESFSHVVFMGMGEPFLNYDALVKSLKIFTSPLGFYISQRRITVSTVGVLDRIEDFVKEDLKINLTFSLHAPTQELREKIIPSARKYPLSKIMEKLDFYFATTGREITYEYILLDGINDSKEDAHALFMLLKGKRGSVNIIPYNNINGSSYKKPSSHVIEHFMQYLTKMGINVTRRYTKGDDIAAACGQLAIFSTKS